jgi:hypothetical protein
MAKATIKKKAGRPKKKATEAAHKTVVIDKPEAVLDYQENNPPQAPAIRERTISEVEYDELQALRTSHEKALRLEQLKKEDYKYFGDFDKGSAIPAWMLDKQTGALDREVKTLSNMLQGQQVPDNEVYEREAELTRKTERLDQIKNSKPQLSGAQKDRLSKVRDNLETNITASKFTKLEMENYLVDAHEEARRMTEPCVEVDRLEAARMGFKPDADGKVNRNEAEMMWKMACSLLGDRPNNPNTELLRRDNGNSKRNLTVVDVDIRDGNVIYPEGHKYAEAK